MIESTRIDSAGLPDAINAKRTTTISTEPKAGVASQSKATQTDRVTISPEAKALLGNTNSQDTGTVEPLFTGGSTLPPWPPKKENTES